MGLLTNETPLSWELKHFGEDVFIDDDVQIKRPQLVTIGNHVAIDKGFILTCKASIGDYIHIAPYVTIIGGESGYLEMRDFSTLAAGCRLVTVSDEHLGYGLVGPTIPFAQRDRLLGDTIILERFVNVGTNVVILPGVVLAEGTVIGANSLVTKNTKPWTIYYGNPAKPVKEREKERMLQFAKELGYG